MPLTAGSHLGPYEVLAPLGAGGMGEVYRARDTKLGRDVALKVLPAELATRADRLARLRREAQLLAAINHPAIAAIHGLEESDGRTALVLELVEGETLADRVARGPLSIGDALEVARQIADALAAAHEKGIVHRDLKPANVKLRPDGSVKLLDFGLAKALGTSSDVALSSAPTQDHDLTREGVVVGTGPYMSPEQARGQSIDRRTDLWAFGVVLFEMLTGRRLFQGATISDVIAAVLASEPHWSALPAATPASIRRLLARCLERDPKRRQQDAADARIEIEDALAALRGATSGAGDAARESAPVARTRAPRVALLAALACLAVAVAFALGRATAGRRAASGSASPAVVRAVVPLPEGTYLEGWGSPVLALSRDGRRLAIAARKPGEPQRLYVRDLETGETVTVPGSEEAEGPFFSPDGSWLAFAVGASAQSGMRPELKKYALATGLTQSVCATRDYFGGDWSEDGSIVFADGNGLLRVDAIGGKAVPVAESFRSGGEDRPRPVWWPQVLPGGRLALLDRTDERGRRLVAVVDLASRELRDLGIEGFHARYLPSGHLVVMRDDATLTAMPFDLAKLRPTGPEVAVLRDVGITGNRAGAIAYSAGGMLARATGYVSGSYRERTRLVRADRGGKLEPLGEPDVFTGGPRVSPDGRQVALLRWDGTLWLHDLARGTRAKLPFDGGDPMSLAWSPDGSRLAFAVERESFDVCLQRSDGMGRAEVLKLPGLQGEKHPVSFTADGRGLLFRVQGASGGLWLAPLDGVGEPKLVVPLRARRAVVSPDGRWLAHVSSSSGRFQAYVQAFPGPGRGVQASLDGARALAWSADSRQLFFSSGDSLMAVRVEAGSEPHVSAPEKLLELAGLADFDVAPDRPGFLALQRLANEGRKTELELVLGFSSELERLAPTGR